MHVYCGASTVTGIRLASMLMLVKCIRILKMLKHHPLQQAAVLCVDTSKKHACTIPINIYQTAA